MYEYVESERGIRNFLDQANELAENGYKNLQIVQKISGGGLRNDDYYLGFMEKQANKLYVVITLWHGIFHECNIYLNEDEALKRIEELKKEGFDYPINDMSEDEIHYLEVEL